MLIKLPDIMNVNCMLIGKMHQTNEFYLLVASSGQQQRNGNERTRRVQQDQRAATKAVNRSKYGNEPT